MRTSRGVQGDPGPLIAFQCSCSQGLLGRELARWAGQAGWPGTVNMQQLCFQIPNQDI